jgi:hypothetical protein
VTDAPGVVPVQVELGDTFWKRHGLAHDLAAHDLLHHGAADLVAVVDDIMSVEEKPPETSD